MLTANQVSIICSQCDSPFMMEVSCTTPVCHECTIDSDVAECNASTEEAKEFLKWIRSIGGPVRVAKVMRVDRTTVWRHCSGEKNIPKVWIRFMNMSKELAEYKKKYGKL